MVISDLAKAQIDIIFKARYSILLQQNVFNSLLNHCKYRAANSHMSVSQNCKSENAKVNFL